MSAPTVYPIEGPLPSAEIVREYVLELEECFLCERITRCFMETSALNPFVGAYVSRPYCHDRVSCHAEVNRQFQERMKCLNKKSGYLSR